MFTFNDHYIFDNILVGEKSENRSFFLEIPYYNTLIIRAGHEGFIIWRSSDFPDPPLMPSKCSLAKPSADLPKPDGLISRAW